jgi:glycosyltransferase involved in cell wall biosynthesis
MLSWEFPPRTVGGIAAHLFYLSRELVKLGVDTYVVTCDFPGAPGREIVNGAHVLRVDSYKSPSPDFATWVSLMNVNMQKESASLVRILGRQVDIIHAHDWVVANAAVGLKHVFRVPLAATIHSTEVGRRNGLHSDYERMIHQTENWLVHESWRVICCSYYMSDQVKWAYGLSPDMVTVIPNGVDASAYEKQFDRDEFRRRFAMPEEKIVLFVGRLVYEKGVQSLINAMPKILSRVNAKFIIVGDGGMKESLMRQVAGMGLAHKALFTGFIDEDSLQKLYMVANVCVVPSLYEPFGITALEAMAAKTPLVASNTGGLSEIVEHDRTGTKVFGVNPDSVAWGVTRVLLDSGYADWIKNNAYRKALEVYDWAKIAKQTKAFYEAILKEYEGGSWKPN